MTAGNLLGWLVPLAFSVTGFLRWRSNGFWMPRYIHGIAIVAACIGLGLVYLYYTQDAPNERSMWFVALILPALVYWGFMIYGAGNTVRRLNPNLSMHPSMNQDEVVDLLNRHFGPYRAEGFDALKALVSQPTLVELNTASRQYQLRIFAKMPRDETLHALLVVGMLAELKGRRGVAIGIATFEKTESGEIRNDGLGDYAATSH